MIILSFMKIFRPKWINWIKACLSFATVSVLVNGSPTKEFKPRRGLRQGDLLTPFLFIIVAEGLAGLVREASRIGILEGVKVGNKSVEVNLLQFADDTLFFCQPQIQCVLAIKAILRSFEVVSGLKVNFYKSHVGNIGLSVEDSTIFTKCLNSRRMDVPFKYLGMTIGGKPRRVAFWKPIIDKIKARLSNWKGKILSMAGRICLIKSVINALPLFYLSFFKAPSKVCSLIKKIQTKFLWGWGYEERKIAWVA